MQKGAGAGFEPGRDERTGGEAFRVLVRRLRPGDYDTVIAHLDEWWGGRHVSPALPRLFFDHFSDTGVAVEESGELVAFLAGFMSATRRDEAYIHFVGVRPDHRRSGLARAMYERFFALARERGCFTVRCLTSPVNRLSIAYHVAMGFEIERGDGMVDGVPVHLDHDGPGEHRVLFRRALGR